MTSSGRTCLREMSTVFSSYVDSCTRLGSALEELEQTLCLLTGTAAVAKLGLG